MNLPKKKLANRAVLTRHPAKLSCNARKIQAKVRRQQLSLNLLPQCAIAGIFIGGLAGLTALFFQPTKIQIAIPLGFTVGIANVLAKHN